jgi:WD40 repeat protein
MKGQYGMESRARRGGNYWESFKVCQPHYQTLISAFIPPKVMVPSRRLATLLDQARRHQQQDCVFHDDGNASSLYLDHECSSGQFPEMTTHILADHTDEVWKLEWSPDGTMLASAGKDHLVVIWQLKVCRFHSNTSRADRRW